MNRYYAVMFCALVLGVLSVVSVSQVLAYTIETLPGTAMEKDIVVGPGKIELLLDPGQNATSTIYVTNRTGRKVDFKLNVEDFVGSQNATEGVVFLGEGKSPYTLKDYLRPDTWEFTLEQGQRIGLPILVSIPYDAEPVGKYGAVFAKALPPEAENLSENSGPTIGIAARVGVLFFVRVNGAARESGSVKNLSTIGNKKLFENGPINFQIVYKNDGNIHLVPYGKVEITNMAGKRMGEIKIDPYFAMPDSERLKEVKWERGFLFGRYTAKLQLNRGYGDIVDRREFSFWVLPWKILAAGFAVLIAVLWLIIWLDGHFEFKKKS